jgi:hypothetical protein
MTAALHDSPTGYHLTMKTPPGLVYAIVITVVILAVVLFARSQTSSMVAPVSVHAPPPESGADKPPENSADKPAGDAAGEPGARDAKQQPKGPPGY